MRQCPSCRYCNGDSEEACGVCGARLSAAPSVRSPAPAAGRLRTLLCAAGILALLSAAFLISRKVPAALPAAVAGEEAADLNGVLVSLAAMRELRFISSQDKRKAAALLKSRDPGVALSAAELSGSWARFSPEAELRNFLFGELLECALSCRGPQRRQAALEAGMAAAFGAKLPSSPEKAGAAAKELTRDRDEKVVAAGYFLASMCGVSELVPEMRSSLASAPSPYLKVHAACALSRLGYDEGHGYLFSVIPAASGEEAEEAISCLSFSASGRAGELLRRMASGSYGESRAVQARAALALRARLDAIK